MKPNQTIEPIAVSALLDKVRAIRASGARLVQISATALPGQIELIYSFDLDTSLVSFRLQLPADDLQVPSITPIYSCAFLYENEMHDLFNVKVQGINIDFHGNLYNTTVKYAFGDLKPPASKPQPPAAPQPQA
jgi:ech hydrogenase subunit D